VIGADAVWKAIVAKDTGKDYCVREKRIPAAQVRIDGTWHAANRAAMEGERLTLRFDGCDTRLVYAVDTTPDWVAFHLKEVQGTRPSRVTLLRIGITLTERVGSRLGCGWDDEMAICLRAANMQTRGRARRRAGHAELTASTQDSPGPKLEGAGAALIAAPPDELPGILRRHAAAFDLPRNCDADGVPSKDLPLARESYWFLTFGEKDVERVIELCRKSGFRQVMMNSGSWCRTVGHYTFHKSRYPDGIASLKRTVARLHDAGIRVGMHCFASKVSKRDPYVTPVPDRRFWVKDTASLAGDIAPEATAIATTADLSQWPGSPVCKRTVWEGGIAKHQEVVIDDEIVRYERIGPKGKWNTLLGCQRGAWGTKSAAHDAGTSARRYGVDGCINGYIIDQETDLLDETTDRLAHIFNTCGFDMVYFDGGEDVDRRRFHYYVSNFQAVAMGKFRKRPLVHMGTIMTHRLWHSFTRSSTVDTYLNTVRGRIIAGGKWDTLPSVKDHVDRSVRYMRSIGQDMMPGELGWFGIWPQRTLTLPGDGETEAQQVVIDGLQYDQIEYLMCKSLAYDAPISLQTSFRRMNAHPLTDGLLELVKAYEELRRSGTVDDTTKERLREPGKNFLMLSRDGEARFLEVRTVPQAAGGQEIRAFVGQAEDHALAAVWHRRGRAGQLVIPTGEALRIIAVIDLQALKADAELTYSPETPGKAARGHARVPVGARRRLVLFADQSAATARKLLAEATFEPRPPVRVWRQAEDAERLVGKMAKGSAVGVKEEGAFGDVLLCPERFDRTKPQDWFAEYRVEVPHEGRWTLWARVRYPSGTDHSFGIVLPGQEVTLSGRQVLGNCGANGKRWHWTGRGGGSTSKPPGKPIVFDLEPGEFVFRITPREGAGSAEHSPRLDALCLTDDPAYVPTEADAREALAK
jgi:hypothetical protein